ncbi:CUB domain-containing protein 2-like [Branchiostoma floridae x Branchiostoma belcheri]
MAARLFTATIICGLMFTTVTSATGCGGDLTATSGGPVTSPNYPSNYGNNENCEWSITVPEGSIIRLTFDSFYTEYDYDRLTIYDGASDNTAEMER